jgi:hypothetical protein
MCASIRFYGLTRAMVRTLRTFKRLVVSTLLRAEDVPRSAKYRAPSARWRSGHRRFACRSF